MVSSSISSAVARVDTLNKFPRTMEQMGYGADVAQQSITRLSDGIQGLPTTLDGIVSSTQRLAIATGSLEKGTDTALALNNALLASGASSEAASRGAEQYIQALSRGKIEGEEWKTLMEIMPYAVSRTAEAFGYTGTSGVQKLREALASGKISMTDFNNKIIELNGGVGGFAEVAKTASGGISTSWANVQNAVSKGVANVIQAIDTGLGKVGGVAGVLDSVKAGVNATFVSISRGANSLMQNLDKLALAALGVGTAFGVYKGIQAWNTAARTAKTISDQLKTTHQALALTITKNNTSKLALAASTAKQAAATAAAEANEKRAIATKLQLVATEAKAAAVRASETAEIAKGSIAQAAKTKADEAATAAKIAETNATAAATAANVAEANAERLATVAQNEHNVSVGLGTALIGYLTGSLTLHQLATAAATVATNLFTVALHALPLLGIAAAVGALVVGVIALVKWIAAGSEEYRKHKEQIKELLKAHEEYNAELDKATDKAKQAIYTSQTQTETNAELIISLRRLISTNNEAGANNESIARTVEQLNKSVDGLNLSYDETSGKLNANIDQVEKYIKAQGQLNTIKVHEEEYNRLLDEQLSIRAKISAEESRQEALSQQLADKTITQNKYNNLMRESSKLLDQYRMTENRLGAEVETTYAAIDKAAKSSAVAQVNAFEAVNGAVDANGKNLKQLAMQYSTTTSRILEEMKKEGSTLSEWSDKKAALYTKEGQSLQGLANQWGLTTDQVRSYMSDWGMSLDEFSQQMQATHTREGMNLEQLAALWGTTTEAIKTEMDNMGLSMQEWSDKRKEAFEDYAESVRNHTDSVINSFKEIPAQYELSAAEMIRILKTNRERYAEWKQAMVEISSQVSGETLAELEKLGPAALSAINEMRANGGAGLKAFDEEMRSIASQSASYVTKSWEDPSITDAPSAAINASAQKVRENTALTTAVSEQAESAKTAIGQVDFSEVGQKISTSIVSGISGTDAADTMKEVAAGLQNNSSLVTTAITAVTEAVIASVDNMRTQATDLTAKTVAGMSTEMSTGGLQLSATAMIISLNVANSLLSMVSGGVNAVSSMIDGMLNSMNVGAQSLYAKASEIASRVASALNGARAVYPISNNALLGSSNIRGLYQEPQTASGVSARLAVTPDIASIAVGRMRSVAQQAPLGGVAYASRNTPHTGGTLNYVTNLTQNITAPKPLSASEMTREGQDLLRRSRWQLP